jgi:Zn-dependent peptidase ImmA (M78 family)
MARLRNEAIIKPELLVYAREESGFSLEAAADKIPVKPARLLACEQGKERLTINQLRSAGNVYKRPLAFFFLPQPPPKTQTLRDFRRLADEASEDESPALRHEVRRARYRRQVSLDLYDALGEEPPRFTATTSLSTKPDNVANKIRELLDVSQEKQYSFRSEREAFNQWRTAIEDKGVLVFQAANVKHIEMRGFSISEDILPVVVVNIKDAPQARLFTMLHELTHIMLRTGGLCTLEEHQNIEVFCNKVAGAALVPQEWLLNEKVIKDRGPQPEWDEAIIKMLAHRYSVSREVIVRRLLIANYATHSFYQRKHEEYRRESEHYEPQNKEGFAPPDVLALSYAGRKFVQLVLDSYHQEKITTSDVSDYLEVKVRHFENIERAARSPTLEIGAV